MAPVSCKNSSEGTYKLSSEKINSHWFTKMHEISLQQQQSIKFCCHISYSSRNKFLDILRDIQAPDFVNRTKRKNYIPEKALKIYPVIWVDAFFMQAKKRAPQQSKHKLRYHLQMGALWEVYINVRFWCSWIRSQRIIIPSYKDSQPIMHRISAFSNPIFQWN